MQRIFFYSLLVFFFVLYPAIINSQKIDTIWKFEIQTSANEEARFAGEDNKGNIILGLRVTNGTDDSSSVRFHNLSLFKLSKLGKQLWRRDIKMPERCGVEKIALLNSGRIVVFAPVAIDDNRIKNKSVAWLLNTNGDFIWEREITANDDFVTIKCIKEDDIGRIFLAGSTLKPFETLETVDAANRTMTLEKQYENGYLLCLNSNGDRIWEFVTGGFDYDSFDDICFTGKDSILLLGRTNSSIGIEPNGIEGGDDMWLSCISIDGKAKWNRKIKLPCSQSPLKIIRGRVNNTISLLFTNSYCDNDGVNSGMSRGFYLYNLPKELSKSNSIATSILKNGDFYLYTQNKSGQIGIVVYAGGEGLKWPYVFLSDDGRLLLGKNLNGDLSDSRLILLLKSNEMLSVIQKTDCRYDEKKFDYNCNENILLKKVRL